jgi:hypothetical protein
LSSNCFASLQKTAARKNISSLVPSLQNSPNSPILSPGHGASPLTHLSPSQHGERDHSLVAWLGLHGRGGGEVTGGKESDSSPLLSWPLHVRVDPDLSAVVLLLRTSSRIWQNYGILCLKAKMLYFSIILVL